MTGLIHKHGPIPILLVTVLLPLALLHMPADAIAQALIRVDRNGPLYVGVTPAEGGGVLRHVRPDGSVELEKTLPFSPQAVCVNDKGTVIAPADGGLAWLDDKNNVVRRINGLVYGQLVCADEFVYASGRTLRVHRFRLPDLTERTNILEAHSWIPRLFAVGSLLVTGSWDGDLRLHDTSAGTTRRIQGKPPINDVVVGPEKLWITLSDDWNLQIVNENGVALQRQKLTGAWQLAFNRKHQLAVLVRTHEIVLYQVAKNRMRETSRHKLEGNPKLAILDAGDNTWAILDEKGIHFHSFPSSN